MRGDAVLITFQAPTLDARWQSARPAVAVAAVAAVVAAFSALLVFVDCFFHLKGKKVATNSFEISFSGRLNLFCLALKRESELLIETKTNETWAGQASI